MAHTQKQKKKLNIIVIITKLWAGINFFLQTKIFTKIKKKLKGKIACGSGRN